jgi:uncharacterized protein involved in outer membrane biogenesis
MVQTTLLGLAIAFILALIAALIGPFFIDWNQYKPRFEAEATRVIGAPVRVEGALDARLLPVPILRLRKLAIGKPGDASKVSAERLDVELSLGSLLRGEWRASELSLGGLALDIGLDKKGRIDWPSTKGSFDIGALAIDRLNLNGRVDLHDAASDTHLVLEDLVFSGDVRALATTMRGEGHIRLAGAQTPFRVSTGPAPDNDKATRVRVTLDPGERPLAADLDGVLSFEARSPRFDGSLMLTQSSQSPWRVSSKVKASPASASFDEMEWTYGPEDVALKLNGSGSIQFGKSPKLQLSLSAQQLNADGLLAKEGDIPPFRLAAKLRDLVATVPTAPMPAQIGVNVDQIALGGRPVQNLAAALRGDSHGWTIDRFEIAAPGNTRVTLSGAVKPSGGDARLDGALAIDSRSSQSFQDWLLARPPVSYRAETPLTISADVGIDKNTTDLSNVKMTIDGNRLDGRVTHAKDGLVAILRSSSFDFGSFDNIDGVLSRLKAAGPSHAKISLDIAQAAIGGQAISPLNVDVDYWADAQAEKSGTVLSLVIRRADLAPWLGAPLPVDGLSANLMVSDDKFSFVDIDGKFGGVPAKGRFVVTRADEPNIEGEVALDSIDVAPLISAAIGGPGRANADPLGRGVLQGWRGRVAFKAARANLPGGMVLSDLDGLLRHDGQSLFADDLKAGLGGGEVSAKLQATRSDSGTSVSAHIQVTNSDGDSLKYRGLVLPEGKASLQMTLASEGRSLAALANALSGSGVLMLDGVRIEGLDTGAFDAAVGASDSGQTIDDTKLKAIVEPLLARGAVAVDAAQIPFDIRDGRLRVGATTMEAGNARIVVSGGYDMPADQADLRATLTSSALGHPTAPPDIEVDLHGTPDRLDRSLDVSGLSSWLALRSIERETKRLDQLEGRGTPSLPHDQPHSEEAQPSVPLPVPAVHPRKRMLTPKAAAAAPNPPPGVTAEGQALAPLPPPIDIRPAPGARPKKPRPPPPEGLPPVGSAF